MGPQGHGPKDSDKGRFSPEDEANRWGPDTAEESATQITRVAPVEVKSGGTKKAFLVMIYPAGTQMGKRVELTKDRTVIGRGSDADIVIDRESVSRKHAAIERRGRNYWVADLNSTNGTYLNDVAVDEAQLRDGDFVKVGNAIYKFLSGGNVEAAYYEEIYRLTIIDGLTGAHNKRYFQEFLSRELARCARTGRPLSLVMFDIDHFKNINDTYGHLTGDFILKELCRRVRTTVRKDELLARYGGEEFCVVLPEAHKDGAMEFAERIRSLVEARVFVFEGTEIPVTISVGVSTVEGEDVGFSEMVHRADERLYEAKRTGRNRVCG
jgi:diguanylate cyclase (GGDEF)-like protein